MSLQDPRISKILFITLSNMGDVILTLPVLDYLKENFPQSQISVMVGPRPKEIFEDNPHIFKLIIYDKYAKLREKIKLFFELKKERFDLIVDLRNTLYGALLPSRFRTSPFLLMPHKIRHMKERNLYRLESALKKIAPLSHPREKTFYYTAKDKEYVDSLLKEKGIVVTDKIVIVSPGTGGDTRRWESDKFTRLCQFLIKNYKVILVGSKVHQTISQYIYKNCPNKIYDFTGLTNLRQLICLLKRAALLVSCDTGTLQLGSYIDTPIVALFGPSDEARYGPWSHQSETVKKEIFCRPCRKANCRLGTVDCMHLIKVEDVLRQVESTLVTKSPSHKSGVTSPKKDFKRILVVRTDKVGDVLLSTPVIKALRDNYPCAYIAMMVSPYTKEIVEGNPYLDELILYDKDNRHKGWLSIIEFANHLKKKRFDLAIILHPTNRVHLLTFFAAIPKRVGYNRKLGFLLTDKIKHTKQHGEKHELEYNLDLLGYLRIPCLDKSLFMPIKPESERWANELFIQAEIEEQDKLLAIHPSAGCHDRIWPNERFAKISDRLIEKYGFKVLIIAGPKHIGLAEKVMENMRHPVINLAGQTSISQLASILKRCSLFISNDSGPVHIASAVGVPVIAIFGRSQKGLSPKRWGPVGKKDRFIHKEVGCIQCLAHNCKKEFLCLKAISVDDVLEAADSILTS